MTEVLKIGDALYQVNDAEAAWLTERLSAAGGIVPPADATVKTTYPTSNLAEALALVQAEIPEVIRAEEGKVEKDGKVLYKYSYADLSAVTRAILPMLGRVGLSWVTMPTVMDGHFVLVYRLQHASGDFLEGTYPLPAGQSPQQTGSAITYARRYCLCSVTGIAPGDDDDAAEATAGFRGDRQETARPAGMSSFERSSGLAFLAIPTADQRAEAGPTVMRLALSQALDFRSCLDERNAWDTPVDTGTVTWGVMLAGRVADEIEHAAAQADVNTLWSLLKAAGYNPELEGKSMTSRIKERAAAIVARNAKVLDDLGALVVNATEVSALEGEVTKSITLAFTAGHITEEQTRDLTRMLNDRVLKLQREAEGQAEPRTAPIDGDNPWGNDA